MKKSKINFVLFIGLAYFISNQTTQAYKLYCPSPEFIALNDVNNHFEYSAPMKIQDDPSDRKIVMRGLGKEKFDVASFSLQAASINSNNQLSCLYGNSQTSGTPQTITLLAKLPKESTCTVTYPKGHEYPELVYFKCSDSRTKE